MPNIEDFTAGNIDIRPQEIGVESTAAAGRRLGAYGSQIAESYTQAGRALGQVADTAEKYLEHREVNTGAAHGADLIAAKNQSWNDFITGKDIPADAPNRQDLINQRINNPQAAKQWREQSLEPDLAQFQQGFLTPGGRQWASEFANRYRLHMAEHTAAEQSSMAGAVVQANNEKATDSFATATFNDPSALKTNLGLLNHSIDGTVQSSPTMSPVDATKVTTELKQRAGEKLVAAAIQGAILKGGNWQTIANDPAYSQYVKPAENAQFERMERTYQKGQQVADKQIQLLNKQIAEADQEKAMQKSFTDNVKFDPNTGHATVSPQYIQDMVRIGATSTAPKAVTAAQAQINWAESKQHGVDATFDDPEVKRNLRTQIADPKISETDGKIAILNADADKKITPQTTTTMLELNTAVHQGAIKDPMYETAMKDAEQVLGTDIEGKKRSADFAVHFMQQYLKARADGTLKPDDLSITKLQPDGTYAPNPDSLISKAMAPYKRDPTTIMMNTLLQRFGATPEALSTIAGQPVQPPGPAQVAPPRPAGYPSDAQWDATRGLWVVIRDGVKYPVLPAPQPASVTTMQP